MRGQLLEAIGLWLGIALLLAHIVDDLTQNHGGCGFDQLLLATAEIDGEIGCHAGCVDVGCLMWVCDAMRFRSLPPCSCALAALNAPETCVE